VTRRRPVFTAFGDVTIGFDNFKHAILQKPREIG
jgi:hypothetical protein